MNHFKTIVLKIINRMGYDLNKKGYKGLPIEASVQDNNIYDQIKPYTMTSNDRIWALINAVNYVIRNNIDGDFVECGVWRGGSAMAMALALIKHGIDYREIWLYDTYEGMTDPSGKDIEAHSGKLASSLLMHSEKKPDNNIWCVASLQDVSQNMYSTNYPKSQIHFIKGDVVETLKVNIPEKISILRLDTDWYESTKSELEILYPMLVRGGVCIIDDYGYWRGSREAVDEYFEKNNIKVLLNKIDETGRLFIKP